MNNVATIMEKNMTYSQQITAGQQTDMKCSVLFIENASVGPSTPVTDLRSKERNSEMLLLISRI